MQHQGRGIIYSIFLLLFLTGTFTVSPASADLQSELTAHLHSAYPPFTGKVREISGTTLIIQQTSPEPVQPGSMLLVGGKTQVRVLSVDGMTVRAGNKESQRVRPGEPVSGLPRPLQVALVPLSRESLQYLLMHPLPKGEIETVRTEDVLTAMIEKGIGDFSTIESQDLSVLQGVLKTDLILQVKTMEGLGQKLLRVVPVPAKGGNPLPPFSILLTRGTFPSPAGRVTKPAPLLPQSPPPMPVMIPAKPGSPTAFVPLVPEQQEPAPTLLRPEVTKPPVRHASLRMPGLDRFHDPSHWIRTLELSDKIVSMATGSLTAPKKKELVLAFPGEIRIYSYSTRKNRFREQKNLENKELDTLFRLETYDLNKDGQDEIIGDTDRGVILITVQRDNLIIVQQQEGFVVRKIAGRLFAQEISNLRSGTPMIYPVSWNGREWIKNGGIRIPDGANLFSLISLSTSPPRFIGSDNRLSGRGDARIDPDYGRCNVAGLLDIDLPIVARSLTRPEGELLISNTTGGSFHIGKVNYPTGGKVVFLHPEGALLSSPPFLGYVSDIALYDMDGDGTENILVSEISSGLLGTKSYILRYE